MEFGLLKEEMAAEIEKLRAENARLAADLTEAIRSISAHAVEAESLRRRAADATERALHSEALATVAARPFAESWKRLGDLYRAVEGKTSKVMGLWQAQGVAPATWSVGLWALDEGAGEYAKMRANTPLVEVLSCGKSSAEAAIHAAIEELEKRVRGEVEDLREEALSVSARIEYFRSLVDCPGSQATVKEAK